MINKLVYIIAVLFSVGFFLQKEARSEALPFKEEMQSDRPDFTEGAFVIDKEHFQLESGYTFSKVSSGGDSHVFPEMLMRIGVFDAAEIRIFWEGYNIASGGDGSSGYSLGFKTKLSEASDMMPRLSLIGELGPVSPDRDYEQMEGGFKLLGEIDLFGQDLASNLNLFRRDDGSDVYMEGSGSLSIGVDLLETVGLYLEAYAIIPFESATAKQQYYFNGGFTFLANENLQFDIRSGLGLNSNADNMFVGSGFVFRI